MSGNTRANTPLPSHDGTRFVLLHTSHAGNVGAAARAMKVMGFSDLVLVAPRFADVLSHADAVAMASGAADILIFPNIESGNVFYKSMTYLAGARTAAAVVGTTAPCILTSRADSEDTKFFSIALGCRLAL